MDNHKSIFLLAFKDIFKLPALAIAITFFSLGNLYFYTDFSLVQTIFSSILVYSLPGQIVLAEQYNLDASIINILLSVFLVNIRFLPMSFVLVPYFPPQNTKDKNNWFKSKWYAWAVQFVAITGWQNFIENYKKIPISLRKHYYFYSHFLLFVIALVFNFLGYILVDKINQEFYIALLITNPIYFLCLFVRTGLVKKDIGISMLLGGILIIPFSLFSIKWGVIFSGIIAGSIGFYFFNLQK